MAHSTCLMSVHVGAPVQPWLFATDAMGANEIDWGGFGMAVTQVDEAEITALLRTGRGQLGELLQDQMEQGGLAILKNL